MDNKPEVSPDPVATSLASMIEEWVDGGIRMGTDWRPGLVGVITRRLKRFQAPAAPVAERRPTGQWRIPVNGDWFYGTKEQCERERAEYETTFTPEDFAEAGVVVPEQIWSSPPAPVLSVWYGAMPESNGKTNWTAILHRKDEGLMGGVSICLDRSEYPDRVRYEADRMRYLIGELGAEPCILDYDADKHSGYVKPSCATCQDHGVIGYTTGQTAESFDQGEAPCPDCTPVDAGPVDQNGEPFALDQWWVTELDNASITNLMTADLVRACKVARNLASAVLPPSVAQDLCKHGEEKKPGACDECAEEYQQMRADDRRGYENRG
jgi:hypothetical protein